MKRISVFIICLIVLVFWSSCRKDFEFSPSTGDLKFERDTVYLDTVFTNIGSSTYTLKVYNKSNDDIVIPTIQLERGSGSFYRLNVDGSTGNDAIIGTPQEGRFFENVELLAKDSLFIFVETTYNTISDPIPSNEYLYTDRILFDSGSNQQDVDLVTLVKDAIFIYPNRDNTSGIIETLTFDVDGDGTLDETTLEGRFLETEELTFTNEKPYVIYGYAGVNSGETLTMEPGTRVHFHADSGIIITDGASLQINGTLSNDQDLLENEVILEGDRLEPLYQDIPGQWGTIWLFNGSLNNVINYTTIKNATIGILAEGNATGNTDKLSITNSQIYNTSSFGLLGRASSINAENLVINNSGQSSFAATFGGKYNFTHCTIANYWNNSFRQFPALLINDFIIDENNTVFTNPLTAANFTNCIIYGNNNPEIRLEDQGDTFNFKFTNCLIRFNNNTLSGTGNYDFDNSTFYEGIIRNQDPDFEAAQNNKLRIGTNSAAKENARVLNPVGSDLLGNTRNTLPDIGAYNVSSFEE